MLLKRYGKILSSVMLFSTCLLSSSLHAEGETLESIVYTTAPSPETIAGILFPNKYRGVDPLVTANQSTPAFGMIINFRFDSADILPESEPMLQSLGEMMGIESVASRAIVVEGHTDSIGTAAYNQQLSERRARAIKQYLVDNFGIAPKRLLTVGKGERELFNLTNPEAPVNRRATFRPAKNTNT